MFKDKIKDLLETPRLLLRPFTIEDVDAIYQYGSNPNVTKYLIWQGAASKEEAKEAIENFLTNKGVYAISLKDTNLCIGCIDIRIDETNEKASFGYLIDEPYWYQGYMKEALDAILKHCFEDIGLHRVESTHYKANPNSGKVMQKAGMLFEGEAKQEVKVKGVFHDVLHYGITKSIWKTNR